MYAKSGIFLPFSRTFTGCLRDVFRNNFTYAVSWWVVHALRSIEIRGFGLNGREGIFLLGHGSLPSQKSIKLTHKLHFSRSIYLSFYHLSALSPNSILLFQIKTSKNTNETAEASDNGQRTRRNGQSPRGTRQHHPLHLTPQTPPLLRHPLLPHHHNPHLRPLHPHLPLHLPIKLPLPPAKNPRLDLRANVLSPRTFPSRNRLHNFPLRIHSRSPLLRHVIPPRN